MLLSRFYQLSEREIKYRTYFYLKSMKNNAIKNKSKAQNFGPTWLETNL